ncbi:MAG: glutamyl-tRNA reductase [Methanomicrobiales archaeon]|jgi:glutamyl-tRNA reductase|nr:glutamyl-tRNA reductase [Methanomicrobiales archaeon]
MNAHPPSAAVRISTDSPSSQERMQTLFEPLTIASLAHHNTDVTALEKARFSDETQVLTEISNYVHGALLLQTCNRVELIVQGSVAEVASFLHAHGRDDFSYYHGYDALRHLLHLAAGIHSMIIGEDQILGQMRGALRTSEELDVSSPLLKLCIDKAIHTGVLIRKRTGLNQGAVSVGSAAVLLAQEHLGDLSGKHILVLGSGEMGVLVANALCAKNLSAIYVANRTYDRACQLAEMIHGTAVKMDDISRYLGLSDVVISCTTAPHFVLHESDVRIALSQSQWPLDRTARQIVMIDLAQPRDIDPAIETIPGVVLFTIDDLADINDAATLNRRERAQTAKVIIEEELVSFVRYYNQRSVEREIASLYLWAERIRSQESSRAIKTLASFLSLQEHEKTACIIDDMSHALVKKLLSDLTRRVKEAAANGDDSCLHLLSGLMDEEK